MIDFLVSDNSLRVAFILLVVFFARLFLNNISHRVINLTAPDKPRGKRLRTLLSIFNTFFSVAILVVGGFMILQEFGFDITPLVTSAGIIGLAVGFGSQALVKDVISGFFLILEGQFDEGDEVEINGKSGVVEAISLRTISLRGKKKELHIIPNGSITLVTNFSKD